MFPEDLVAAIRRALERAAEAGELPAVDDVPIEVKRPRDRDHGDWATSVALALAGRADRTPRRVAEILLGNLPEVPHLESADIAGPGFVNFILAQSWYLEVLRAAAVGGRDHARL
ncbi:MAG: arginine--tRNA ligase, partial [Acidimicrobiia bacterium]